MYKKKDRIAFALGFRERFIAIGILFLAAFLAVAAPYLADRAQRLRDAEASIAALAELGKQGESVRQWQDFRKRLFYSGAGGNAPGAPPSLPARLAADEKWRELRGLAPEDTAGRRRPQHFAAYSALLTELERDLQAHGALLGRGSDDKEVQALVRLWLFDLPVLIESLSRLEVLAGVSVREGMVSDRLRGDISAAIAVARHAQTGVENAGANAAAAAGAGELKEMLDLARTIADGLAISNATYSTQEIDEAVGRPLAAATALHREAYGLIRQRLDAQRRVARQDVAVTLGVIVVASTVAALGLLLSYRRMARNIELLGEGAKRLAAGDLSTTVTLRGNDELQRIAESVHLIRDGLKTLVNEVVASAHALAANSLALARSSAESAERARQQVLETQGVVAAVAKVGSHVAEIVVAANDADTVAKRSDALARAGVDSIGNAREVLGQMNADVALATESLERLESEAAQISNVVAIIDEIAGQTNLLALNAAIEAARAGDSGRGFSVVADEVRKLAERTTQSTREIAATIERMQAIAGQTTNAVRTAASHVSASNTSATNASDSMARVRDQAALAEAASARIGDTLARHKAETDAIANIVASIAALSEVNGKAFSAAAESARTLEDLAQELQHAIGKFRLPEAGARAAPVTLAGVDSMQS